MLRKFVLSTALAIIACGTVSAQPASGNAQAKESLYVLVCDDQGHWDPDHQARYRLPIPAENNSHLSALSTDWKALTDTSPFRRLSYTDRLLLLGYPERLLSSSWAQQYFANDLVVVLKSVDDGRIEGRLFDLAEGRESALVVPTDFPHPERGREEALKLAAQRARLARSPVVVGPNSKLYHQPGAPDLSAQTHYEAVPSPARAEQFGFSPCPQCYSEEFQRQPLYDSLDERLGQTVASQIEAQYPLLAEGEETARVQAIGNRLLGENRFLDQGYRFLVLETETVNAYAAPTGPIYVTTGLLEILETDDQLAAVLGHELSHSERRHSREQYQKSQGMGVMGLLINVATGFPLANLGTNIASTIMVRGYSRGYELQADRDGMMTAYAAGYRPEEYLLVQDKLEKLMQERGGGSAAWLRSHPGGEKRKARLSELLDETAAMRARLDQLQVQDPGLAIYLKSQLLSLTESQAQLADYLSHYEALIKTVDRTPLNVAPVSTPDRGVIPVEEGLIEIAVPQPTEDSPPPTD